jgi:hypothetical protein
MQKLFAILIMLVFSTPLLADVSKFLLTERRPIISKEELQNYPLGLGNYGYFHDEAHQKGVVRKLKNQSVKDCCDDKGECRSTVIKMTELGPFAILEKRWCPIPKDVRIFYDIPNLPGGWAIVCASKSLSPDGCPTVWCAADEPKT